VTNDSRYYFKRSILRCPKDQELQEFFFSLMDYRNNYFLSKNPKDIIHFYEGFENREELIDWMKERPKGSCEIKEVEGEKDVVVVIPTADFEGKYAKRCREEIFKGLHIIFVVSGIGNNYFNIAHNCNVGIKKAMEYNPKWVVLSNDDMYKIDEVGVLKEEISKTDSENIMIIFAYPLAYHSYWRVAGIRRKNIYNFIQLIYYFINKKIKEFTISNYMEKKYDIKLSFIDGTTYISKLAQKMSLRNTSKFIMTGDFGIYNSKFIHLKQNTLFDENFINGHEDMDLSFDFFKKNCKYSFINYKIKGIGGASLGHGVDRGLRSIINTIYFELKYF